MTKAHKEITKNVNVKLWYND